MNSAGFVYPTRMAVIQLPERRLFVWSPIALTEALRREVDELGVVAYIIAPNSLHHVFAPDWQAAYPGAHLCAAPGLSKRRKDIRIGGELGDTPASAWAADVDQVVMRGNAITTEVVFFHRKSGTVLFTDLLQNFPRGWFKGWRALIAKLDGMMEYEPTVPRKFRVAFTNRKEARTALKRILAWPVDKVLMAHGTPVVRDGHAFIQRAFRWLQAT